MKNCSNCPYSFCGHRDSESDICDGCTHDPDTGWVGFTDHSINKHFNNEVEANDYYNRHRHNDDDDNYDEITII